MSEIRRLTRNGETFYPLTHIDGVIDRDGNQIEINDIFDISEYNASGDPLTPAEYSTLSLALAAIPLAKQKGGMSIRYIESSGHTYQQYRLSSSTFNTTTGNWISENIDNVPTASSDNLVKSGGVAEELALGGVYDVSAKNPTAGPNSDGKWESLSALLSDANLSTIIPTNVRKGGMSIKFVQTSDNKYVQYRYMIQYTNNTTGNNKFVNVSNWQGVDDEPTAGSENLVESGGVLKKIRYVDIPDNSDVKSINDAILLLKFKSSFRDITLQRFTDTRCTFFLWQGETYSSIILYSSTATVSGTIYMWDTEDLTFIVDFSKTQSTVGTTTKLYNLTVNAFTYADTGQLNSDINNIRNANPYIYYESAEYFSLADAILELAFYSNYSDISLQRFDYQNQTRIIKFFKWEGNNYTEIIFRPEDATIVGDVYSWDNEYARLVVDFSKTNLHFGTTAKKNKLKIGAFIGETKRNSEIGSFVLPRFIDCPIGMENNIFLDCVHSEPDWNTNKISVLADNTVLTSKKFIRKEFSSEESQIVVNFHRVKDETLTDLYSSQTTLRPVIRGGQNKTVNICVSGSSNVDGTEQAPELFRLLSADGDVTVNQIGTRHKTSGGITYNHEGRGGWSWKAYTNPTYETVPFSDKTNAFMHNGSLDFSYYMQTNFPNLSGIDIFIMNLGSNDVTQGTSLATNSSITDIINYAKTFIDALHNDYPNCKFIVGMPSIGAPCQYKADRRNIIYKKSIQMLNKAYIDNFDNGNYNANTLVCPFTIFMNREALFKHTDIVIDSTYSPLSQNDNQFDIMAKQERIYTDIIHCTAEGYQSWGSGLYRTVRAVINGLYG